MMPLRGIRGATVASANTTEQILTATRQLLAEIQVANPSLRPDDLASILFTVTPDLNATYPALAARQLGWGSVPLLCFQEIPVPDGLPHCIRILLHWNTPLEQPEIQHVYLKEAIQLRPDLNPAQP